MEPIEYIFKGLRKSVYDSEPLRQTLARQLDLPQVDRIVVERESIDARRKPDIYYIYNLKFTVSRTSERLQSLLNSGEIARFATPHLPDPQSRIALPDRPVVVGFGPAGMFAGLFLAQMGYRPIIFERGEQVDKRVKAVRALWEDGILNPDSNLQFGEGGAGTFSDGKLATGKASPLDRLILETFVEVGAPETILFNHKPHIGTDHLRRVVSGIRERIISLGGEVHFEQTLSRLHVRDGAVEAITVSGQRVPTRCVVLAIGNSARDTISMLSALGIALRPKSFAVGVRIEHPAVFINEAQYGKKGAAVMPAADYKLTHHHQGSGVYSFCMCPGGQVVCASSEPESLVTNGMSRYARDAAWSNSAIVVGVDPARYGFDSPMAGIAFQQEMEQKAYRTGGGGFIAPAQRAVDFLAGKVSAGLPETSYRPGVVPADLRDVLPAPVIEGIQSGLARFDRIMPGFLKRGVLIGPETRTSSPVCIVRDENCRSVSTEGLYLLGEGAGYAGGIMTCARDAVQWVRLVMPRGDS